VMDVMDVILHLQMSYPRRPLACGLLDSASRP
jgi:hypothetical protein